MSKSLTAIFQEENPYAGLNRIVQVLAEKEIFVAPQIYFISPLDNCFKNMTGTARQSRLPIDHDIPAATSISATREGCVLAFVTGDACGNVSDDMRELVSGLLLHFFDQCFFINYFKEVKKPIDFTNANTYYKETTALLSSSLAMPMVAIRRLNTANDLESLCFFDVAAPGQLVPGQDFLAEEMPPPFSKTLRETEDLINKNKLEEIQPSFHCNVDINSPDYEFLNRGEPLCSIKTFVIFPVVYGHELFGIMSCAARCRYVFSDIQKHAVSGLMQIIGVAISNFLRYHEAQELHYYRTEHIIDTTAVEVAKSTKHELSNAQAEASTMLVGLKKAIDNNQTKKVRPALQSLEDAIDNLLPSIRKLSFGDKADKEREETTIRHIWKEVTMLFSERLKRMNVEVSFQGSDCKGSYFSEMLKIAFLNLILNSIDAFKSQRKRGRKITLACSIMGNNLRCQLDYSDNAGGLDLPRLDDRMPGHLQGTQPSLPLSERIFLPKVSSKGGLGSGWGLYFVRRVISMHRGSINLIDYKNGCTFRIDMPRYPQDQ